MGHCWHNEQGGGISYGDNYDEGVRCCWCGLEAFRHRHTERTQPAGHGARVTFYREVVEVTVDGGATPPPCPESPHAAPTGPRPGVEIDGRWFDPHPWEFDPKSVSDKRPCRVCAIYEDFHNDTYRDHRLIPPARIAPPEPESGRSHTPTSDPEAMVLGGADRPRGPHPTVGGEGENPTT